MKTDRTFGVEIEMQGTIYNPHWSKPDYVINNENRHSTLFREVKLEPGWRAVYDGSCGSEFVSPPLIDTVSISKQIKNIIDSKYNVSFTNSGLHVHVGAQDVTRTNLINLLKFCRHYDRIIYSFVHPSRFKNEYCRPLQFSNEKLVQLYNPNRKLGANRYHGCNLMAYEKHGTIEFRYSESTLDYDKIRALVDLFIKITNYVVKNGDAANTGKKSPRKRDEKRAHLLRLIGVEHSTFKKLINTKY